MMLKANSPACAGPSGLSLIASSQPLISAPQSIVSAPEGSPFTPVALAPAPAPAPQPSPEQGIGPSPSESNSLVPGSEDKKKPTYYFEFAKRKWETEEAFRLPDGTFWPQVCRTSAPNLCMQRMHAIHAFSNRPWLKIGIYLTT